LQREVFRRIELQETTVPQSLLAFFGRAAMYRTARRRTRRGTQKANGVRMKVKLTDRFCSNIKSASRMDYFDEVATGLALRVTEQGSKSWTYN
jgi:hypothetical protein